MYQCTCVAHTYIHRVVCIVDHLMGCSSCIECRCVTVCAVQCSAGGVHHILKLYMLQFEQSVFHCTDKLVFTLCAPICHSVATVTHNSGSLSCVVRYVE